MRAWPRQPEFRGELTISWNSVILAGLGLLLWNVVGSLFEFSDEEAVHVVDMRIESLCLVH